MYCDGCEKNFRKCKVKKIIFHCDGCRKQYCRKCFGSEEPEVGAVCEKCWTHGGPWCRNGMVLL